MFRRDVCTMQCSSSSCVLTPNPFTTNPPPNTSPEGQPTGTSLEKYAVRVHPKEAFLTSSRGLVGVFDAFYKCSMGQDRSTRQHRLVRLGRQRIQVAHNKQRARTVTPRRRRIFALATFMRGNTTEKHAIENKTCPSNLVSWSVYTCVV